MVIYPAHCVPGSSGKLDRLKSLQLHQSRRRDSGPVWLGISVMMSHRTSGTQRSINFSFVEGGGDPLLRVAFLPLWRIILVSC